MDTQNENKVDLVNSPHVGGKKMSSSLKERLRRTARSSFTPPIRHAAPTPDCDVRVSLFTSSAGSTSQNDDGSSSTAASPTSEKEDEDSSLRLTASAPESDDGISSLVKSTAFNLEKGNKVSSLLQSGTPSTESDGEISLDMEVFEETSFASSNVCKETVSSLEDINKCDGREQLKQLKIHLAREIEESEEKLRKLKLVQYYETNSEFQDMLSTVNRWVKAAQESVRKLYDLMPEPKIKFSEFLQYLQIEHDLIHYDAENDTFLEEAKK